MGIDTSAVLQRRLFEIDVRQRKEKEAGKGTKNSRRANNVPAERWSARGTKRKGVKSDSPEAGVMSKSWSREKDAEKGEGAGPEGNALVASIHVICKLWEGK